MTLFVIPHYALGAELSQDHHARTTITAYRQFFGFVGTGLVFLAGVWFFSATPEYPTGQLNPDRYQPYGLTLGVVIMIAIATSSVFTHNAIPHLTQAGVNDRFHLKLAFLDMWRVVQLRSFAILLAAFLVWVIGLAVFRVGEIYLATYFWRLDQELVFLLPFVNAIAALLVTPVWVIISRRVGKKWSLLGSLIIGVSAYCLFIGAKINGMMPEDEGQYVLVVFGGSFLISMILAANQVISGSMVADVADEFELESGLRREGILFAAISFVAKMCHGIGAQLTGLIILYAGLQPRSDPDQVPLAVSNDLAIGVAGSYFILVMIAMLLFAFYPITESRHREIMRQLQSKAAH